MSSAKEISPENRAYYRELGLNIAFYRRRAGLTQEQLAEKLDISRSHLSALEDLARALGTTPSKLLEFRD